MNFNAMDLIKIKEAIYDPVCDSQTWEKVSNFISKLIDIDTGKIDMLLFENDMVGEKYWYRFYQKQEMIEFAFQINILHVFKEKK